MAAAPGWTVFHGWRVVGACFVAAVFTWGFGVFGGSVYLAEVTRAQAWPVSLVAGGLTVFYLTNALALGTVGRLIDRHGARPVFCFGAVALAIGTAAMGRVEAVWQLYAAFLVMGLGYAAMSVTGLSATLAPWFERHQGRAVAIATTGASLGAMLVVPLFVTAIDRYGFAAASAGGALLTLLVLLPLFALVLRFRRPEDLGIGPDGDPPPAGVAAATPPVRAPAWTRAEAVRSRGLRTVAIGFAFGLVVQVGFLTHHVKIAEPVLGTTGAGWLVGATGLAGLLGRLLLARVANGIDLRLYTAGIMAVQALVLALIALLPGPATLIGGSLVYGFCLGQITSLSPIIVRREFGAAAFGAIYGAAAGVIQFSSAFGPAVFGALRDLAGGYGPVLAAAAVFEAVAMAILLYGRPAPTNPTDGPLIDGGGEGR
ncbi:MAG: MFS transporter [Alphaproteobacteria bacterium]